MLGTNDSKLVNWNAKQYEKELEQLIMTLQASSPKAKIYLLTPLWRLAKEDKKVQSILFVIFSSTRNLSNYSACELEKMCRNDIPSIFVTRKTFFGGFILIRRET